MWMRTVVVSFLVAAMSSAASGERLAYRDALDLLTGEWWTFSCPADTGGSGRANVIKKKGATVTAKITFSVRGWLSNLFQGQKTFTISIRPAADSFPADLKSNSVCGDVGPLGGCFIIDKNDEGFKLYYFEGVGFFGRFDGPDKSNYCDFEHTTGPS
jgi:hypothetical protein